MPLLRAAMYCLSVAPSRPAAKGWSPIQIALPVIVGVVVLTIAGVLFYFYRRRKNAGTPNPKHRRKKAWQNANLQGPRRFFGLIPDVLTVRPRKTRDAQWEIDDNVRGLPDDISPSSQAPLTNGQHGRAPSRQDTASMHSRATSVTSLLSTPSYTSSGSRSQGFFSSIAHKFSSMSLSKKYQSGTTKGPDYKRVQVLSSNPDRRFRLDGLVDAMSPATPTHPQGEPWTRMAPTPPPLQRDSTLPSVLDIRGVGAGSPPSTAARRTATTLPSDLFDLESSAGFPASPMVAESDYSLMTSDLLTPVTPSRDAAANVFGVSPCALSSDLFSYALLLRRTGAPAEYCFSGFTLPSLCAHQRRTTPPKPGPTSQSIHRHHGVRIISSAVLKPLPFLRAVVKVTLFLILISDAVSLPIPLESGFIFGRLVALFTVCIACLLPCCSWTTPAMLGSFLFVSIALSPLSAA